MDDSPTFQTYFGKITSLIDQLKQYNIGQQLMPLMTALRDEKLAKAKASPDLTAALTAQAEMVSKEIAEVQSGK